MPWPVVVSLGLGFLLLIQSAWSLRGGFGFLRLVRKGQDKPVGRYTPRVGLVVPCKGHRR